MPDTHAVVVPAGDEHQRAHAEQLEDHAAASRSMSNIAAAASTNVKPIANMSVAPLNQPANGLGRDTGEQHGDRDRRGHRQRKLPVSISSEMGDVSDPQGDKDRRADRGEGPPEVALPFSPVGRSAITSNERRDKGAHPGQFRRRPHLREKRGEADRQHQRDDHFSTAGTRRGGEDATDPATPAASARSATPIRDRAARSPHQRQTPPSRSRP